MVKVGALLSGMCTYVVDLDDVYARGPYLLASIYYICLIATATGCGIPPCELHTDGQYLTRMGGAQTWYRGCMQGPLARPLRTYGPIEPAGIIPAGAGLFRTSGAHRRRKPTVLGTSR